MADVYEGLTIEIDGNTTKLSKALRDVRKEARGFESELKLAAKALKMDPNSTRALQSQQAALKGAIGKTREELNRLGQAEEKLAAKGSLTEKEQRQWSRIQSEIVITEQRLKGYQRELVESVTKQNMLTTALGKASTKLASFSKRVSSLPSKMRSAGTSLTMGLTVPLGVAAGAAVKAAVELDTSLTNVKKTVDGTAEDYQRLKDAAVEFSRTNAVSASEILDIQSLGAQLGYGIDELQEFGEVVSGLDIATNMSAETAASELAQFANIMGMAHDQTRNYGSTIVALGNNFATTESDISSMAMRIAGAGKQIGLSSADVLGLATALSSMGINAEAGGTAISTIMAGIDKQVATNGDNLELWAQTAGMSADEFARAWEQDAAGALSAVLVGMDAATQSGGNMTVMLDELGITSIRQTDTFKRLASNSEFLGRAVDMANLAWEENTALDAEVANRNDSLAAKFEMLRNRVVELADEVGAPLADAMLAAVDAAEPLFGAIESGARAFADMSAEEQRTVLMVAAMAGAIGPMLSVGSRVVTVAGAVSGGLSKMTGNMAKSKAAASVMGDGMLDAAKKGGRLSRAMSVLKGGVGQLGLAVGALALATWAEYSAKVEAAEKATDGLRSTMASVQYGEAVSALGDVAEATRSVSDAAQDAVDSQAALADSIGDAWGGANEDAQLVDRCARTIEELTGRVNANGDAWVLTAEEQRKLSAAVSTYNELTGSSVSIVNSMTGELTESSAAIRENADAWADNAKVQAAQEALTDLCKQQAKDKQALDAVNRQLEESEQGWGWWIGDFPVIADPASEAYHDLTKKAEELAAADEATSEAIEYFEGQLLDAAAAEGDMEDASGDLADATGDVEDAAYDAAEAVEEEADAYAEAMEELEKVIEAHPRLAHAMYEAGWSADELMERLQIAGVDAGDLADTIDSVADQTSNAFGKIEQASDASLQTMLENMRYNAECTQNWGNNLEDLYNRTEDATIDAYIRHMAEMGPEFAQQVQYLHDATDDELAEMAYAWANNEEISRKAALQAIGETSDAVQGEYDRRVEAAETAAQKQAEAAAEAARDQRAAVIDASTEAVAAAANAMGASEAEFVAFAGWMGIHGDDAVKAFTLAISSGKDKAEAAAIALSGGAEDGMEQLDADGVADGKVDEFSRPLYGSSPVVRPAGAAMAQYGKDGAESVDYTESGQHAAESFADGIRRAQDAVKGAVGGVVDIVTANLKHSVPREGPLRNGGKGEAEWGAHAVENFAAGMRSRVRSVQLASQAVAAAAGTGMRGMDAASQAVLAQPSLDVGARVSVDASSIEGSVRAGMARAIQAAGPSLTVRGDVTLDASQMSAASAEAFARDLYRVVRRGQLGG